MNLEELNAAKASLTREEDEARIEADRACELGRRTVLVAKYAEAIFKNLHTYVETQHDGLQKSGVFSVEPIGSTSWPERIKGFIDIGYEAHFQRTVVRPRRLFMQAVTKDERVATDYIDNVRISVGEERSPKLRKVELQLVDLRRLGSLVAGGALNHPQDVLKHATTPNGDGGFTNVENVKKLEGQLEDGTNTLDLIRGAYGLPPLETLLAKTALISVHAL